MKLILLLNQYLDNASISFIKFLLGIVVLIQIGTLCIGIYLLKSNNPYIFCMALFIIITNIVFGGINIHGIIS